MIIDDRMNPELSIYYLAYFLVENILSKQDKLYDVKTLYNLFMTIQTRSISFTRFMLILDFLYLLDVIKEENGEIIYVAQ